MLARLVTEARGDDVANAIDAGDARANGQTGSRDRGDAAAGSTPGLAAKLCLAAGERTPGERAPRCPPVQTDMHWPPLADLTFTEPEALKSSSPISLRAMGGWVGRGDASDRSRWWWLNRSGVRCHA